MAGHFIFMINHGSKPMSWPQLFQLSLLFSLTVGTFSYQLDKVLFTPLASKLI